jgi:hypothetical protein
MLKYSPVFGVLIALSISSANAQQQEALLQKLELPETGFDIIVATPKFPAGAIYNLDNSPDALIIHLIGNELALGFEDENAMLKAFESLRQPSSAFHVESKDRMLPKPVAIYIGRRDNTLVSSIK